MNYGHVVFRIVSLLLFVQTSSVYGEPVWSEAECIGVFAWDTSAGFDEYFYVIESDLASELRSCTALSDNELTQDMVVHQVRTAAEFWNVESLASGLHYAGQESDSSAICNWFLYAQNVPRVFIEYQKSCLNDWWGCSGARARLTPLLACGASGAKITFFGSLDDNNSCINPRNWFFGERSNLGTVVVNPDDFISTMIHEFGHALGLDHVTNVGSITPNVPFNDSVMSVPRPVGQRRVHLGAWDKDCVDDNWQVKTSSVYGVVFDTTGQIYEPLISSTPIQTHLATEKDAWMTSKGAVGQNSFKSSGNSTRFYGYPRVSQGGPGPSKLMYVEPNTIGSTTFGLDFEDREKHLSNNAFYDPLTFFERDPVYGPGWSRLHYLYTPSNDTPAFSKYIDTNDAFFTRSIGALSVNTQGSLRSFVPVTSAFDPLSNEVIFATVDLFSSTGLVAPLVENDPGTKVRIHVGYRGSYSNLNTPITVSSSVNAIVAGSSRETYTLFRYGGGTWFAPAISCADDSDPYAGHYNCIVAWNDWGVPEGHVLYRFFRVTSANSVQLDSNVYVLPIKGVVGAPALTYFGGYHYFAVKTDRDLVEITRTPYWCRSCFTYFRGVSTNPYNIYSGKIGEISWGSSSDSNTDRWLLFTED